MADMKVRSMPSAWMVAAGVFVVALILLLLFGYGFLGALLLSLVLAALVAAFFLFAAQGSHGGSGSAHRSPSPSSAGVGTSPASHTSTSAVERPGRDASSGGESAAAEAPSASAMSSAPTAERQPTETPPAPAASPSEHTATDTSEPVSTVGVEPERLEGPREGGADDLKRIKGVGPKLEGELNSMGIYHLDQIASWSLHEVAWMDENLVEFRGRVSRDDWVGQAKQLTSGGGAEASPGAEDGEARE